jgi:hypothetical protein
MATRDGRLRVEGRGAVAGATITVTSPESTGRRHGDWDGHAHRRRSAHWLRRAAVQRQPGRCNRARERDRRGRSSRATFAVATNTVTNAQSAIIVATAAGITRHAVITVWDEFHFANGSIAILPGGTGSGRVTSQPAGIDCTITRGDGTGTCDEFFPVGTVVRLDARGSRLELPGLAGDTSGLRRRLNDDDRARYHDRLPARVRPPLGAQALRSPARISIGSRLAGGASGHSQRGS